jgi:signal transduction histidine kinase
MQKLKILILVFIFALCIPLAYFVVKTFRGLEQEEAATLSYFAETLFDEMEQLLAVMVQQEESRAIDEYNFLVSPAGSAPDADEMRPSPLSQPPDKAFILGYFQNNPDGSFQTPLVEGGSGMASGRADLVGELMEANTIFNRKRATGTDRIQARPAEMAPRTKAQSKAGLADKYLDFSHSQRSREYLGQKEKRVEQITVNQAANIAKMESAATRAGASSVVESQKRRSETIASAIRTPGKTPAPQTRRRIGSFLAEAEVDSGPMTASVDERAAGFQVEVAPLQAVFLTDDQIYIFRRVMVKNQIYRQGFVLQVNAFLDHLIQTYFLTQPMARFAVLRLRVVDQGRETGAIETGRVGSAPEFVLNRSFPSPFRFLQATLACQQIPRSAGRHTLVIMLSILAVIVLLGLFAIYQSTRTIVDLSERRSQFVSSVTHELKTPLTNIRMYIEMLEQGIADTPEREQEYYRVLDSEGARLSRLINNVLELAKLEKKQRHIDLQTGNFEDVITAVLAVMGEKIRQDGFTLRTDISKIDAFRYDREVMIQILINLIENSMKFGKGAPRREINIRGRQEREFAHISVSDTGPGIPRKDLKKVFEDFYRVENSLTRTTRGTGIGLALVKKFVQLMQGSVTAANNRDGPGCTITISLPV